MTERLPETVTREEIAAMLNITPQRTGQLAAEGVLKRGKDGRFQTEGAGGAYVDFLVASKLKRLKTPAVTSFQQRQMEFLDHKIARHDAELITMAEAVATLQAMGSRMAGAIRSVPSLLPPGDSARCAAVCEQAAAEFEAKSADIIGELQAGKTASRSTVSQLTEF